MKRTVNLCFIYETLSKIWIGAADWKILHRERITHAVGARKIFMRLGAKRRGMPGPVRQAAAVHRRKDRLGTRIGVSRQAIAMTSCGEGLYSPYGGYSERATTGTVVH